MKNLLLILFIVFSIKAKAQFGFTYNPTDSTYTNFGGWSLVNLYAQKDSTANTDSYFIKYYHKNIHFIKFATHNDGVPNTILWLNGTQLQKSPITSIPISSAQVISGLGFTPLSVESDPLFNTKFSAKTTDGLAEGSTNLYSTNTRIRSAISLTTTGSGAATYNNSTGAINIPTITGAITPTYNHAVSRPVNSTSFTPSSTQPYRVYYNVEISCTATIGGASSGSIVLQYFNGSTWVNTAGAIKNSNTVTLAIALNSATIQGGTLSGEFPANTQLRLVSTSSGTTTITYNTGEEVLY